MEKGGGGGGRSMTGQAVSQLICFFVTFSSIKLKVKSKQTERKKANKCADVKSIGLSPGLWLER